MRHALRLFAIALALLSLARSQDVQLIWPDDDDFVEASGSLT